MFSYVYKLYTDALLIINSVCVGGGGGGAHMSKCGECITICNGKVTCVHLIYNILNHLMQLNNMYLFHAAQTIDILHYKDQLLNTDYGHNLYLWFRIVQNTKNNCLKKIFVFFMFSWLCVVFWGLKVKYFNVLDINWWSILENLNPSRQKVSICYVQWKLQ
jgi:hypothetical protein